VAQIAHLLHGVPDMSDLGLYALLFLAFWTAWIVFTLYANVAYENTHVRSVLAAMLVMAVMAVMAAAVPGVHDGDDQHARRRSTRGPSLARSQTEHLSERLSLFVLIVLGEGVAQVVEATSDAEWDKKPCVLAVAAFFLLATLWALSFEHGYAGVPHLTAGVLPSRAGLPLHCFVSGCLAAPAAALGAAAEHLETLPNATRWLLSVALPCCVLPLLLAAFGAQVRTVTVVWLLVLITLWPIVYERLVTKSSRGAVRTTT
jgi:low temperature requirement protein LtrA